MSSSCSQDGAGGARHARSRWRYAFTWLSWTGALRTLSLHDRLRMRMQRVRDCEESVTKLELEARCHDSGQDCNGIQAIQTACYTD